MRIITYNIVPILLVILTGYMIYADKSYWGWVLVCALATLVGPAYKETK
jgi:hypothetical protein